MGIVAATLAGGKALGVMGKGQLGVTLNNTTQSILRRPTAAPITTTAPTATPTTRPSQPGAKPHGTSQLGAAKTHGATDLSVSTSAPSAKPGPRKAVQFNDQVEVQRFVQTNQGLLPTPLSKQSFNYIKDMETRINNVANIPVRITVEPKLEQGIAYGLRHNVYQIFKDKCILDNAGKLTADAVKRSDVIKLKNQISNPRVIEVLTKEGASIENWVKYKTESVTMPNSQRLQIHYYKNNITGQVDYTTMDYKVVGEVKP